MPLGRVLLTLLATTLLVAASTQTFFKEHCVKCHGPKMQKGDLRLDTLARDSDDWHLVLEVLENGDMPPKKEPRPDAAKLKKTISSLLDTIEPPIALRRLNRVEYELTVRDLLGIDTSLADLLPEDGKVQGFDNVADGLGISSILMERYLETADLAFESTIRRIPPLPAKTRRAVVINNKDNLDSFAKKKGGVIRAHDSFVKFTPGWPPVRIDEAHPIEDGRYRCRIATWPHNPSNRTLAIAIYAGPLFGPGKRRFMGMFDVTGTPQNPRIIEFESFLREAETLHIVPWIYPDHVTWRDKHEKRPGIGVAWAETHGPLDQAFPSIAQKSLFGNPSSITLEPGTPIWMRHRKGVKTHNIASTTPDADAERIIRDFIPRAFRRPVAKKTADPFVNLTLDRLAKGRTFEQAVRAGVSAVLCAPQFLLLNRKEEPDDFTLASKLSYFLWSSMPDQELLDLAAQGKLTDPNIRHAQVERMLNSPKRERFIKNFTGQWLGLREIEFTSPSTKLFPEFDPMLQESMVRETKGFFSHLLEKDLSISNFIDSDFTVLNERLALHYDIPGVTGHEHSRVVTLPTDSIRGGVLTHASILKITANGTNTSPVLRGVWILDNIFSRPVPPPPPGIPAIEPDIRGAISIRDQLAKHSSEQSCARCHDHIDPPGFALEIFNPIGGERTWYRSLGKGKKISKREPYTKGPDVEQHGAFKDGTSFQTFDEFRQLLLKDDDLITRSLTQKLLIYASGRPFTLADRPSLNQVLQKNQKNPGLRTLIHMITQTDMFLRR
ncbi:MAG: hypothetical protein ACJA16_004966 [Akkermansiaceae bacterium]|jgi:hypothetical protein